MSGFSLGVIADTHGHLDQESLEILAGSDLILHAGDIGCESVLDRLRSVAPVVAVTGNGDEGLYHRYPWDQRIEVGGFRILLCHWYDNHGRIHPKIESDLREWRPSALVYGHTHEAVNQRRGDLLFFNPGYAGPPGPGRVRSLGRLSASRGRVSGTLHALSAAR